MRVQQSRGPLAQQASEKVANARQIFEGIRNDPKLSQEGKQEALAREWWDRRKEIKALEAQELHGTKDRRDTLHRKLFGPSGFSTGTDIISQRDAADRASRIESPDEADRLITQARRNDDTTLLKAIAQHAYEQRWISTLEHFANGDSRVEDEISELYRLNDAGDSTTNIAMLMSHAMAFDLPKPDELSGLSTSQLDTFVGESTFDYGQPAAQRADMGRSDRAGDYAPALNSPQLTTSLQTSLGGGQ